MDCVVATTAPEEERELWDLNRGWECALKAARKLLRNGRWVGILLGSSGALLPGGLCSLRNAEV